MNVSRPEASRLTEEAPAQPPPVSTDAAPGAAPAAGGPNYRDTAKASSLERWLLRKLLRMVGDPPLQVVLWDGEVLSAPSACHGQLAARATPVSRVLIRDPGVLWKLLFDPDLGFGDAFSQGRIVVEGDLAAFLEMMHRTMRNTSGFFLGRLWGWLNRPRRNSRAGSRDNIHRHYDIGNEFYKLWLDDDMVYTCAYFPTPESTLEEAQTAKMDHVCRKLRLQPGQKVIEAGCGWGSLARHMARHYGVTVRAFNISHEQVVYARERARAEGLDGRVEYVEDDYRNITGGCDAFASVGMLEHVGVEHYRELGAVVNRCLKPTGLGLIHSIGRSQKSPTNSWLEKRIFPGSYMPTLGEMTGVFEPFAFSILDVENLRLHYAKTLEHWLSRFEAASDRVAAMFDANFVRAWRLYLVASMTGFTVGGVQLFQVVFAPHGNNEVPWTRNHLYDHL